LRHDWRFGEPANDQDFALPAQQVIELSLQLEQSILELMT